MTRRSPGTGDIIPALNIEASAVQTWVPDHEAPDGAPPVREHESRLREQYRTLSELSVDRRRFNKLLLASLGAAGFPAGLAGCGRQPAEEIVPYVSAPENVVPGQPRYYASVFTRRGFGYGVLVESHQGRPTKVEGNPDHPATLGASDVFMQAELLNLYDPDRSRHVTRDGERSSPDELRQALEQKRPQWADTGGEGLHILTPPLGSPSLAAQLDALQQRYPEARWHQWQPLNHDHVLAGARMAFDRDISIDYRLQEADVVVQLDGDLLSELPGSLAYARDFASRRDPRQTLSRIYAAESQPGLLGAVADHRLALRADRIELLTRALVAAVTGAANASDDSTLISRHGLAALDQRTLDWMRACAEDLRTAQGRSLIVPGVNQTPATHALCHWLNDHLGNIGNTVIYREPVMQRPEPLSRSLQTLVQAMADGRVDSLILIDCDPAFDAPADLRFAERLQQIPFALHLGSYVDGTARRCQWHAPLSHALESWGDARAFDGTEAIQQPLISPLHDSVSAHSLLAYIDSGEWQSDYDCVRRHWAQQLPEEDVERAWRSLLIDGLRPDSKAATVSPPLRPALLDELGDARLVNEPVLQFAAAARLDDGRYANNAWLQELPDPFSKLTWGNALLMSPLFAADHALANGDVVEISIDGAGAVSLPVWITPDHPDGAVTLPLGYGREIAGNGQEPAVADGIGVNGYPLRLAETPWWRQGIRLRRTGRTEAMAITQHHADMEGREPAIERDLAQFTEDPEGLAEQLDSHTPTHSLFPEPDPAPFDGKGGYDWAMSIDLNSCIGCGACTAACQAENNIPVVGREQVLEGREMHWIRIDRYYHYAGNALRTLFQPMPCQHCENAPCEYVCPVGATVHDSEGLNVMVYNRCIGTRDCSQNCPYKVRRFNFLDYNYQEPASTAMAPARNPDVTVRSRGVMEKCTYCVQRISHARREAKKDHRPIRDGDVVTACQQACPTRAITFGNINDSGSAISEARRHPLDYSVLAELNTRPRTTYIARISNRRGVGVNGDQLSDHDTGGGD